MSDKSIFIRDEGFGPIKNIVERNQAEKSRLDDKRRKSNDGDTGERNAEPAYEPDPDTGNALRHLGNNNVFERGGYKKSSDRHPYENNN